MPRQRHALVQLYGSDAVRRRMAEDARDGHVSGVWNTEPQVGGLILEWAVDGYVLRGGKNFASGTVS